MEYKIKTDTEIVQLSLNNKDFFAILIERYESPLSRYVRRLGVGDNEDVQDLLQNVFIKTYQNLNDFDQDLSFSSWIYRITHNETISFFRKKNVRPEGNAVADGEEILLLVKDDEEGVFDTLDKVFLKKHMKKALGNIGQKYQEILVLRYFENKSYKDISDILQIPMGSVAINVHRAKKSLKKELEKNN